MKNKQVKDKHIQIRIEQCLVLANASNCVRRKFGALLLDPDRNVVLMDGYNGAPRGGGELCGGNRCLRDDKNIESGTMIEHGCHHAEMNVICNAAAGGVKTNGAWLFVTGEPCIMCSKLIHHAGIAKVIIINGGFIGKNGTEYLLKHNVKVEGISGPADPRKTILQENSECLKKTAKLRYLKRVKKLGEKLLTKALRGIPLMT